MNFHDIVAGANLGSILVLITSLIDQVTLQTFPSARQPCNTDTDILLLPDNDSSRAFLQCHYFAGSTFSNPGKNGIWRSVPCPEGHGFVFEQQRCVRNANEDYGTQSGRGENRDYDTNDDIYESAIGDPCSADWECSGGATCIDRTCDCQPPLIRSGNVCARRLLDRRNEAYPGESCYNGESCLGGSRCNPSNKICTCATGMEIKESICVPTKPKPSRPRGFWHPPIPKKSVAPGGRKRVIISESNEASHLTLNRIDGGPDDLSRRSGVGRRCRRNRDCTPGAYCRSVGGQSVKTCSCLSTHVIIGKKCFQIIYPGNSGCEYYQQCSVAFDGTTCVDGVCECPTGMTAISESCRPDGRAPKIARPGESCNALNEVCIGGSACIRGRCVCPDPNMIISGGRCKASPRVSSTIDSAIEYQPERSLVRQVAVGEACEYAIECTSGATCERGMCICLPDRLPRGGRCIKIISETAAPLETCYNGEKCSGGSVCDGTICNCPEGMQARGEQCVRLKVPPTAACDAGEICGGGSRCDGETCRCPPGTKIADRRCVKVPEENPLVETGLPRLPPGRRCDADHPCGNNARCIAGKCRCPEGMKLTKAGDCQKVRVVWIGSKCSETVVCGAGSFCGVRGFCVCPEGTEKIGETCLATPNRARLVRPNGACTKSDECGGGSYCTHGFCVCPQGTNHHAGECIPDVHEYDNGSPAEYDSYEEPIVEPVRPSPRLNRGGRRPFKEPLPFRGKTAPPGGSCAKGQRCRGGSYCGDEKKCVCPVGTTATARGCKRGGSEHKLPELTRNSGPSTPPCPGMAKCRPPNCFCSPTGTEIPNNMPKRKAPQMVVLTFDDAVNGKNIDVYKRLFDGRYKNPNGCSVKASFFVSHEWTNYDEVQWLSYQGHEVASNSITHTNLREKSKQVWVKEMDGLRRIMSKFGNIRPNEITGMRAPQLVLGGDDMFDMMKQYGFLYDNSMTADPGQDSPPFWPQTLDYQLPWNCQNDQCPKKSHPGIWEIPINQFYGYFLKEIDSFKRGSMLAAAISTNETQRTILNMLRKNFIRSYENNKAPYVLTLNSGFTNAIPNGKALLALEQWMDEVAGQPDIWFVTLKQLILWMQHPTPYTHLKNFKAFGCNKHRSTTKRPCRSGNKCLYKTPDLITGEHLFKTCNACPRRYPWLGNPEGR